MAIECKWSARDFDPASLLVFARARTPNMTSWSSPPMRAQASSAITMAGGFNSLLSTAWSSELLPEGPSEPVKRTTQRAYVCRAAGIVKEHQLPPWDNGPGQPGQPAVPFPV